MKRRFGMIALVVVAGLPACRIDGNEQVEEVDADLLGGLNEPSPSTIDPVGGDQSTSSTPGSTSTVATETISLYFIEGSQLRSVEVDVPVDASLRGRIGLLEDGPTDRGSPKPGCAPPCSRPDQWRRPVGDRRRDREDGFRDVRPHRRRRPTADDRSDRVDARRPAGHRPGPFHGRWRAAGGLPPRQHAERTGRSSRAQCLRGAAGRPGTHGRVEQRNDRVATRSSASRTSGP